MLAVPTTDRVLMGPGPCNPYPEAVAALGRPMLGHLDPEFLELLDELNDRLRVVLATANDLTFPLSGTGSAGMEAAIVNTVGPGDAIVVGVNGVFGQRMVEVARRCGADVAPVEFDWGRPVDPERLAAAHPAPKVIAVVHAETSTGTRSDLAAIGSVKGDALLLADVVTSAGGIELAVDGWGVDVAYSGTQKCLGVAPGLAPMTFSAAAHDRFVDRSPSWYLDVSMIADYVRGEGGRSYHHTPPISMLFSLHAGLGAILDEGLDAAVERHARCGRVLQDGLVELGFELFAAEGHRLPELTTVRVPEGIDEAAVRRALLERYGIEIGGGLGAYAGRMWRIGCMGHTARMRNVRLLLAALAELLDR